MSLEQALAANTAAMIELTAALLKAGVVTPDPKADKPKKEPEAKKPSPAVDTPSDTASTPASLETQQNASNDGAPANDDRQFTVEEVTALVTKYAAATVPDGRARMIAILQRHGLKVFRGITDQDTINGVGAMIVKTFEGDGSFDPREAA